MDGNVVALIVAVVGVLGTLTSPVLSQRLSTHARREEQAAQRQDAREARDHARAETVQAEKKTAYITFNAAIRRYRVELMNYLHAVAERTPDETDRSELYEARRAYSAAVAEMQIMAADPVLSAMEEITTRLTSAFDAVKKIELGAPKPGWSFEETRAELVTLWNYWGPLREAIRRDLGIAEAVALPAPTTPADAPSPSV
ncbi:hypothetical protein [Streptacidiphilus rugosus]|uniref:hypothetical protein n=1 Tax=Streptacidiphilus rugosus TaxID=405783 RepID=UPI00055FB087|nr:hypothetical protein [Streptacidiphilus rugosus]